jgi:hypothetical protein
LGRDIHPNFAPIDSGRKLDEPVWARGELAGLTPTEEEKYGGESSAVSHGEHSNSTKRRGLALISANCNEYFSSAAQAQKWIIFSRDTVGAVGTLATSIFALTNVSKTATAAVALGTGAGFTGLDLYTKDFLFSAENVSSVHDLVKTALSAHQAQLLKIDAANFGDVVTALQEDQDLCTPMRIASMVRQSIATAHVTASVSDGGALSPLDVIQDTKVLDALGTAINPPSRLTMEQATALWWLLIGSPTQKAKDTLIYPALSDLANTGKDPAAVQIWVQNLKRDEVKGYKATLNGFSDSTVSAITKSIAADQKQLDTPALSGAAAVSLDLKNTAPTLLRQRLPHVTMKIN